MHLLFMSSVQSLSQAFQDVGSFPGKIAGILVACGILVVGCVAVAALARAAMRR